MAYSRVVLEGDGSTTDFAVNFALDYLLKADVTCRVGTEVDGLGDPVYRTITFLDTNLLHVGGAVVADGVPIVFERTVDKDELRIDYNNGDVLDEDNLMTAQKQAIMLVHEVLDGRLGPLTQDLDAGGFGVTNLREPTQDTDAVTKGYNDANNNSVQAAIATAQAVIATQQAILAEAHREQTGLDLLATTSAASLALGYKDGALAADTAANASAISAAASAVAAEFAAAEAIAAGAVDTWLPYVAAWKNGVPGDGSDQTVALQAIIDSLPFGGDIYLKGKVYFTSLNLHLKHNIRFIGIGGNGPGIEDRTWLRCLSGAVGAHVSAIDCSNTANVSFFRLTIMALNTAFDGRLISYGDYTPTAGEDSAYMTIDDCLIYSTGSTTNIDLNLHGATNGKFTNINFGGKGTAIKLQNTLGVGFANNHVFTGCTFHPGNTHPVVGSGEGVTFISCCFQASTDGRGRAIATSLLQPFKSFSLIGCTFFDVLTSGQIWCNFNWGDGLSITGCHFTGVTGSYALSLGNGGLSHGDPQVRGLKGVSVMGNHFNGFTSAMSFGGTVVDKTNVRGVVVGANSIYNSFFASGYTTAEAMVVLPNSIHNGATVFGSNLSFQGLPAFANRTAAIAGGYTTGQVYKTTTISGDNYALCMV